MTIHHYESYPEGLYIPGSPMLAREKSTPPPELVHALIEQRAKMMPDAIALQFGRQYSMTYRQMNKAANGIARQLHGCGKFVPICAQRSLNLVIALLAVMKAGASYVLLSTDAPDERNKFIVEDLGASVVITDETTQGRFHYSPELRLENLLTKSVYFDQRNLDLQQSPSDCAYVIYTSGTTANPKGVLISHRAAHCGLISMPAPHPSHPLRQLLCHSPNFSAAQRTILGTLARGGTLCLASKESITLDLHNTLETMAITTLEVTPSMLKLIDPSTIPNSIQTITLGGELVSTALLDHWADRVELVSAYGLSECTQLNLRHKLKRGHSAGIIGKPSDTTTAYVLAPNSTIAVAPNTPGELCLAGPQLADGYLNLPEKTQNVFVKNPFGPGKLYRTGDMVKVYEDGLIEIIGRIDQQTKINGHRVEPNESNSVLQNCPGILASTVVSATIMNRNALVAIIVPEKSYEWTILIREIRARLLTTLPSYAIPTYWVQRDVLPLNLSGKLDLATLVREVEAMGEGILKSKSNAQPAPPSFEANRTGTMDRPLLQVAEIIASVLSISLTAVDLEASFQELGGTSLDAIVTASRLRNARIHISMPDIMQSSSLQEMVSRHATSIETNTKPPPPFSLLAKNTGLDLEGIDDAYPVTPLQESIIADSLLGRANYVYQRVYKIRGVTPLQVRRALEDVISRNSIYRTTFIPWKRTFIQMVHRSVSLPWKVMASLSLESYKQESSTRAASMDGPLVRAAVLKDDLLVIDMHHALFDYWSSQFMVSDAISILLGREPIHRASFNSFIAYQQTQYDETVTDFWKSYLENAGVSFLELPTTKEVFPPRAIVSRLKKSPSAFCSTHGITLGALLHTAWALTLSIWLDSPDVIFVTAFSGRDAPLDDVLTLNGPTLGNVPMRVRIDQNVSVLAFAKDVQNNLWTLSKYAYSGLRNALAYGGLKADSFNTMANVLVSKQDFPDDSPLTPVEAHGDNFTQYMTVEIDEQNPTYLKLLIQSSVELEAAQSLLDHFGRILNYMVTAQPDVPISQLTTTVSPSVSGSFEEATETNEMSEARFGLAHTAFENIAVSNPSKVAIRCANGTTLSYGELDAKANSFAHWLIEHGVRHGEMIPLYMEKSTMTLISILAIMKAAASFTPLDPRNPHDRNSFIIKDVGATRIITDEKFHGSALSFNLETIVPEHMNLHSHTAELPVISELTPDSNIYAIYTSGSTGLPKGVLVTHAAVSASTEGMIEATGVTSDWNALWVLNYVFDASYYDVFTIFTAGGTLCLAPQDELLSDLPGHINNMAVQQVMLTPTITKLIKEGPSQVPGLKVLNVCGEKIDVNILEWAKSVVVYNGYGPTEATILMTVSKVEPEGSLNSIGLPLKHAQAVILPADGSSLDAVEKGSIGELCVRGAHLAKGYINRPKETSAAFIRDKDGEPLYRTGDLARFNDNGSLECLGRKDYQVKLNGFRIELGEIENAILRTLIVEACVVSVAETDGKQQLVAFCIFKGDQRPGSEDLLPPEDRIEKVSELASKLTTISHYMMPALFLPFGSFATLPSGKTDRKKLVALVQKMAKSDIARYLPLTSGPEDFELVSTEQECVMQKAWATVLGEPEDDIGTNSVFLALGGDSIAAINIVAACRKLHYTITVSNVLANRTLAEQAKHLSPMRSAAAVKKVKYQVPHRVLSAMRNAAIDMDQHVENVYPCGPGQLEFLTQGHKRHQFWNLTACRELPNEFDISHWLQTTKALTTRNEILRTLYFQADTEDPGSWLQIVLKDASPNWEHIFYNTEEEKLSYMEELRDSIFQFGKPNIKYRLLQSLVDRSRTLCIKVDHGSYDGTLLRILDDQFTALARGERNIPPAHSFKQFVDWALRPDLRNAALEYWTSSLGDYSPSHSLHLKPIADSLKFFQVTRTVDATAIQLSVTPSTVLQAAYSILVSKLCSTKDTLIDNLTTGRNADIDNPQLVNGTCANFLPFRTRLDDSDESVEQLLRRIQEMFWVTTEHGTVGLGDIYKALGKNRHLYSAKLLYCFQPFAPAPPSAPADFNHMRYLVLARSKVYMVINYAVMLEVQKTSLPGGYRVKLQYDSRALTVEQADALMRLYNGILEKMGEAGATVGDVGNVGTEEGLDGLWKL